MKSTSIIVGVLASIGAAQPHGPHRHVHRHPAADAVQKRDIKTVWSTEWVTLSITEDIRQSTTDFWYPSIEPTSPVASLSTSSSTSTPNSVSTTASSDVEPEATDFFRSSISVAQPLSSISTSTTYTPAVIVPQTTLTPVVIPTSAASPTTLSSVTPSASTAPSSDSSSSGGYNFSGDLTFYTLGVGSCGVDNTGQDNTVNVVAVAHEFMTASWTGNPNDNPNCGRKVEISYGGATAQATVVDTCEGCTGYSLDASTILFSAFASQSVGRLTGMEWKWLD